MVADRQSRVWRSLEATSVTETLARADLIASFMSLERTRRELLWPAVAAMLLEFLAGAVVIATLWRILEEVLT